MTNWNFQFNHNPRNFKRNTGYTQAKQKSLGKFIVSLIIFTLILLIAWYFVHPAINWHSPLNFLNLFGLGIYLFMIFSSALYYRLLSIAAYQKFIRYFGVVIGLIVVFVIVSLIALILSRPLVKKLQSAPKEKTNADRIIGQTARVLQPITPDQKGRVRVDGQDWSAAAQNKGESFAVGEDVTIVRIEGVTVYVQR